VRYKLALSAEDEAFRDEVRAFLDRNLPAEWGKPGNKPWRNEREELEFLKDWQYRLYQARLVAIAWPEEYGGRGAGVMHQILFAQEMARRGAPPILNRGAILGGGPVIIQWGSDWQKQRFLDTMLRGEEIWCQTFSEPDAGSDLASLRTRAVADGDDFLVTGQKIWTTRGHIADWSFLLARTDPDRPKHHGITYFLLDMKSPGLTVQPLKQISGLSEFNQVFFDNVRVPRQLVVGEVNQGWQVATNLLNYERAGFGDTTRIERRLRVVLKLAQETVVDGKRRFDDPFVRDQIVRNAALVEALRQIGWRGVVAGLQGAPPGHESAISKLLMTETDQGMSELGMDLLGPYSLLTRGSPNTVKGGNAPLSYLIMRASTIGGGTSEIQRNIIGERVLGLPRD
jgi:alkylation response protein AidB-like acyl-CoA dehydrogenase